MMRRYAIRTGRRALGLTMLAGVMCVAYSMPTHASDHATDLLEAFHLAQNSDPVFDAARYTLEAVQQRIPQARAGLLPSANITGSDGHAHGTTLFADTAPVDRPMKSWAWTLQMTQPLVRVGNVYAWRESQFVAEQAAAQYEQARQELLLRVAQAYFGVIVAQDAIAASEAEMHALEEQLAQVTRGFAVGTHSVTDIDETKARLGLARAQQVAAQNDLASKRADLEKTTGEPVGQLAVLQPAVIPPSPDPMDVRAWMDQARANHPLVRAQRAALAAAQQDIKKNRAEHLPTLDLVSSYGSNYASSSLTMPTDFSTRAKVRQVGVQLNVPLLAGGATNAKVGEAIAGMKKTQANLEAASRQAGGDAQQAFAGVTNGLAQIDALNTAIESAQSAVKGNRVGYRLGIRINIDVLNAEQQLHTAQRDLSKARYETLLQGFKLKAAAGTLEEADLLAVNGLLVH